MIKSNTELLKIAKRQLKKNGAKFRKYVGVGGSWCDMFVFWLYDANGNGKLLPWKGNQRYYCPASIKWCQKNLAQIPPYLAMACDPIYFDWDKNGIPNHIGIVEKKRDTESIFTIEGNTSGGIVDDKVRDVKYVQAIFRPHFPATYKIKKIEIDGDFGYSSIANLQKALGIKVDGVLGKGTVKALQKKCGATVDGAWGNGTSKKLQKMLGVKVDGHFGPSSVKALQKWINKQNEKEEKPTPIPTPTTEPTKKKYPGAFPEIPPKTAKIAVECAYAYGTSVKKYTYKDGKPKEAYKKRLNEAWPNRSGWKYPKSRAGASCDVFVGVVLKCSGYKNAVHAMAKFVAWCKKNLEHVKTPKNGDILTRSNHIMVYVSLKGKDRYANAHYNLSGGRYGAIESRKVVGGYTDIWRPKGLSYFSKGDTFTDVRRLRHFLNWYGNYGLKDKYIFNTAVENAVKDFQKKEGLKVTGRFGPAELAKAKAVRK